MSDLQPNQEPVSAAAAPDYSFGDLPAILWRRKGLLLFLTLAAVGLGCLYLPYAQPLYLVQARVFVLGKGVMLDPNQRLGMEDKDFLATQVQLLRSPMIVKESMRATPGPFPGEGPSQGFKAKIRSMAPMLFPAVADDPEQRVLDKLYGSLSVDPVQGTNIMLVRYRTPKPEQGVALLSEMIGRYREFTKEQTIRELGKLGDTPKIEEELWRAKMREKELSETLGARHPDLRAIKEQIPLWENLLNSHIEADRKVAEAQAKERVRLIDGPSVAAGLVWPRPFSLLGICALIGFTGGIVVVWLMDGTDPKLYSTRDIRAQLGLPVLARIPVISVPWRSGPAELYRARLMQQLPGSPAAETFRALRANLQRRLEHSGGQVLAIVSSRESEGKTTVTADLAFSFAQLGKRVIAVDADLRRGRLDWVFNVAGAKGLTGVLRDGVPLDEAIERSPLGQVDVLARGPESNNPGELLAQDGFEKIIHLLKEQYDVILIDTAPLLCTADGSTLAAATDGVVLAVMFGRTHLSEARRSCEQLSYLGAKTLGVVINQARDIGRYSQYSPYHNYYDMRPTMIVRANGNGNGNGKGHGTVKSAELQAPQAS